ncbi:hypothetical protein LIER_08247 [Lithospermum erythrorhizon]|uniref:DUF7751 domain-containing protein n=1 Tax=Lithospermum erythrorhizon TaxID=34254 RepID=A0AAV3PB54_LITER
MVCIKDQALTTEEVEKIVGWAVNHHLMNNSDTSDEESKLLISSERFLLLSESFLDCWIQ